MGVLLVGQQSGDSHWFASNFTSWILVSSWVEYLSFFSFFLFPVKFTESHVWKIPLQLQQARCCRAHQRVTAVDGTGVCRMLCFHLGFADTGKKKTNWKWMEEGYLLNYSIISFDGKLKKHVQYQKTLTISTVLLNWKELVLLNTWRVKEQHLICASIVFDKPWGNQHLFFLSWKYRRLLEALAFGNECISEEFMDDPDLIFVEMNGNPLWDLKSAWVYFTFTSLILDLKNSFFFLFFPHW